MLFANSQLFCWEPTGATMSTLSQYPSFPKGFFLRDPSNTDARQTKPYPCGKYSEEAKLMCWIPATPLMMPPRNGGRFFSDSTFAPLLTLLTLLTLADDSHDKVWMTPAAGHRSFCAALLKPPLPSLEWRHTYSIVQKKKKGDQTLLPSAPTGGWRRRWWGAQALITKATYWLWLAIIGTSCRKKKKRKKKWTLTADARRHCTPSAPPLPPPQTHPHPPSLPPSCAQGWGSLVTY